MAKKKDATKEFSIEDKLRALCKLQIIDSEIDKIRTVRGELPLEVQDLEDELKGLENRIDKINLDIEDKEKFVSSKKLSIKESEELVKKYNNKLGSIKNNREYDSIIKEQEYQDLESQLAEKKINEFKVRIEQKQGELSILDEKIKERNDHLDSKKNELDTIIKETHKEENLLQKKSLEFEKDIEEHLVSAYKKIRSSVKNGLAIVSVERGASGGSYFSIPPQVQLEILSRNKIITDEHSGRILVDSELAKEEQEKIQKIIEG